ncbi:MAG: 23S rRNA pseudouridine1911/1915/1917 synthase [Planctomycetota bacterium]
MNDGYIYSETINQRGVGRRLDAYLAERYRHASLEEWQAHIIDGRVLLDGAPRQADTLLRLAQILEWHRPAWQEPYAPLGFAVLYDEGGVLVVHKPAGLPTMAGGGFLEHTLVHQLRRKHPDASPMHRLGRWTSGAVLCTRTPPAAAAIAAQFAARSLSKRYRALASGRAAEERFSIDASIGPIAYPPTTTLHAAIHNGRSALSHVTLVRQDAESFLCDVVIETGRPHQIRIHLATSGHPLVGDPLYSAGGRPAPECTSLPGDSGYHLHAAEIAFDAPGTGERVIVRAPCPPVLSTT